MRVLTVSVTERGRALATRLPFEHLHGDAGATVRDRWSSVDALVLVLATGAAVRIVAPLLTDKRADPAVVCLDDAGRFAVALIGGHSGGANTLAREVASLLGAEPVVTTATDATGTCPLDALPGFIAGGDVAGVTAAMLDGRGPVVDNLVSWPLPSFASPRNCPTFFLRSISFMKSTSSVGGGPRIWAVRPAFFSAAGSFGVSPLA